MANWHDLNVSYWTARNAVNLAMIEGRLDRDDAMRVRLSLRDKLDAAATDEQIADTTLEFQDVVAQYKEKQP